MDQFFEGQQYEKINFTETGLPQGSYEDCVFTNCDFSNVELADLKFVDCRFVNCNMSMAKLGGTVLNMISFEGCKLLGLHFEDTNQATLSLGFANCTLDHSSFYKTRMKKTSFITSRLREVDFTDCDLTLAVFDRCDLLDARFENTVLEKADFSGSFHFTIDPAINRVRKAKFPRDGLDGLLSKYDIEIT